MSVHVSIETYNKEEIEKYWRHVIDSKLDISVIQWIDGFNGKVKDVKSGKYWEEDDLVDICHELAIQALNEKREGEIEHNTPLDFQYAVGVLEILYAHSGGEDFEKFNNEDYLFNIPFETWGKMVNQDITIESIDSLIENTPGLQSHVPQDVFKIYTELLNLYQVAEYTGSEIVVILEDVSDVPWLDAYIQDVTDRLLPLLKAIQPEQPAKKLTGDPDIDLADEKWFYTPNIFVATEAGELEIVYQMKDSLLIERDVWSGRVMPGEDLHGSLIKELEEQFSYTGEFFIMPQYTFMGHEKDKAGEKIPRYSFGVRLYTMPSLETDVMGYRPRLLAPLENKHKPIT